MSDLRVSFPKPCAEGWDNMAPAGCNRHCANCSTIVHDLAQLTLAEAEALLASETEVCVRARISPQGQVTLKSDGWGDARRMITAVGTGLGLMAASSPVFAARSPTVGSIEGTVSGVYWGTRVVATNANGKRYKAKVKKQGEYRLRNLPPGSYSLYAIPSCGEPSETVRAAVEAGKATVTDIGETNQCIIVGQLVVEETNG